MSNTWECGTCGNGPTAHGRIDSDCIWNPVPVDSTPNVIEQALLLGDQLEEVDRALSHYRIAWGNYTPDPYRGERQSTRNLEFMDTPGYRVLSAHRESLRKKMFDLDFEPEYDRLRERTQEAARRRQEEAHQSFLDKKDN